MKEKTMRIRVIVTDHRGEVAHEQDFVALGHAPDDWHQALLAQLSQGDEEGTVAALLRNRVHLYATLEAMHRAYKDIWDILDEPSYESLRKFREFVRDIGIPEAKSVLAEAELQGIDEKMLREIMEP